MKIEEIKLDLYNDIKEAVGGNYGFFSVGFDFGYNQNTKPLIDEIAELKASKSEANEAVGSQEDLFRELISLIQTSSHISIVLKNYTITRNNK